MICVIDNAWKIVAACPMICLYKLLITALGDAGSKSNDKVLDDNSRHLDSAPDIAFFGSLMGLMSFWPPDRPEENGI